MLPSLIATDLDGTLLRSDGTISARTHEALRRAEEAGICVVFVTGRPPYSMNSVTTSLGSTGVAICSNGGALCDVRDNGLIGINPLCTQDAMTIIASLRASMPEVSVAFEHATGFSYEPTYPQTKWEKSPDDQVVLADDFLSEQAGPPILKLKAKHPYIDADEFLHIGRRIVGEFSEVTRGAPFSMLEISAPGVTKATALAALCSDRGIPPERVLAFGDMPNDLAMLTWAGTAYAVSNAHPEVLAATKLHTTDHNNDGIARVIESVLS